MTESDISLFKETFLSYLIYPPDIIPSIFFMFTLYDFQFILNTGFSENGTLEKWDKSFEGFNKVFTWHVEMEIGMFRGRIGIWRPATLTQKGRVRLIGIDFRASKEDMLAKMGKALKSRVVNFELIWSQ